MPAGTDQPNNVFTFEQKEAAFREGFQRGYASALGDLQILVRIGHAFPLALSICLEFVRTRLMEWRKTNLETQVPPPDIDQ